MFVLEKLNTADTWISFPAI